MKWNSKILKCLRFLISLTIWFYPNQSQKIQCQTTKEYHFSSLKYLENFNLFLFHSLFPHKTEIFEAWCMNPSQVTTWQWYLPVRIGWQVQPVVGMSNGGIPSLGARIQQAGGTVLRILVVSCCTWFPVQSWRAVPVPRNQQIVANWFK